MLLGVAHVVQKNLLDEKENIYHYKIEYYTIGKGENPLKFFVYHKRNEGLEKLSYLIFKEVTKRLKS